MKFLNGNIGFTLLGVYLILIGLNALMPGVMIPGIVFSLLALVSGVCIILRT